MNMKRMRGRNHRPNGGGSGNTGGSGFRNQQNGIPLNRNHVFDSSGPEMRVRGTAQQLYEKYQQLARDASSNGDRVTGEAYYQHAEHYFRIISAINQAQGHPPQAQPNGQNVTNGQNGQVTQQAPYQNAGQNPGYNGNGQNGSNQNGNGQNGNQNNGQDRNGNYARPNEARSNDGESQNGQHNGDYNNQNTQNRRYEQNGERQQDLQLGEPAQQAEAPRNDRNQESRPTEGRPTDGRPTTPRSFEPRRNEQPRNRQEYQRNDRNAERPERFRPDAAVVDTRIDISSALEAELAASIAEPEISHPTLEARAIPIIPDAPPAATPAPEVEAVAADAPAAVKPKPRGRPRSVKAAPKE